MKVYFKNSFVWLTHKKREKQGLLLPLATHGPVVNQPAVLCIVSLIIAATDDYVVIALQLLRSEVNILQFLTPTLLAHNLSRIRVAESLPALQGCF